MAIKPIPAGGTTAPIGQYFCEIVTTAYNEKAQYGKPFLQFRWKVLQGEFADEELLGGLTPSYNSSEPGNPSLPSSTKYERWTSILLFAGKSFDPLSAQIEHWHYKGKRAICHFGPNINQKMRVNEISPVPPEMYTPAQYPLDAPAQPMAPQPMPQAPIVPPRLPVSPTPQTSGLVPQIPPLQPGRPPMPPTAKDVFLELVRKHNLNAPDKAEARDMIKKAAGLLNKPKETWAKEDYIRLIQAIEQMIFPVPEEPSEDVPF